MGAPDEIDKPLRQGEGALDDGKEAGKDGGKADQKIRDAGKDATDDDQDGRDKARNMAGDGTDAMRDVGDGLDALGLDGAANALRGLADDVDKFTGKLFGERPPKLLPPVAYRVWFGGEGMVQGLLGDLEESAEGLGDQLANTVGQSVLSQIPVVGGALSGLAENAVSSFLHKPGADDEPVGWKIAQISHSEGISELFRCEMILWREERVSDKEKRTRSKGGILGAVQDIANTVSGIVHDVEDAVDTVKGAFSDPLGAAKKLLGGAGGSSGPGPTGEQPWVNIPLDPANWLNQTVTVSITRELDDDVTKNNYPDMYRYPFTKRYVTGVIAEFEDLGRRRELSDAERNAALGLAPDSAGNLIDMGKNLLFPGGDVGQLPPGTAAYRFVRVVVVPSLWKLSLRKNCRIFQDSTALEIVRQVIRDAGLYGSVPNAGGVSGALGSAVGDAMSAVAGVAEGIPLVGDALGNALQGQHITAVPPNGVHEKNWTAKREYCVQYNETDLDFVRRLLEEEGISFYFVHKKRKEELVFIDDPRDHAKVPTIDGRAAPYARPEELARDAGTELVYNITCERKLVPARVTLRDFNHADLPQTPTVMAAGDKPSAGPDYEEYRYPARATFQYEDDQRVYYKRYQDGADGNRAVAKIRLQSLQSQKETGRGYSNVTSMVAGGTLHLKRHRDYRHYKPEESDKSEKLLITRVRHIGYTGLGVSGAGHDYVPSAIFGYMDPQHAQDIEGEGKHQLFDYYNEFEYSWIDPDKTDATRWRPPQKTPKPVIRGVQTATVVDTHNDPWGQDENIHIDDRAHGRIFVRFHWDQRGEETLSISRGHSCWVRVAHTWAGDDFGTVWVPRVGSEVVVGFLDGDPDRPLVLGSVYNALNLPPVTFRERPPDEHDQRTRSVLRTRTNPGQDAGRYNEVMFEDAANKEEIKFTAQKYLLEEVRRHHTTTVVNEQTNTVQGAQGEVVDGKQTLTVTKDRTKTVKQDEVVRIGKHRWEKVEGHEEITVEGQREETVDGLEDVTVGDEDTREQETPVVRELTVYGTRETHVLSPDPDTKVTDLLEVEGSKTDEILGPLTVKAGSFGVGQPPPPDEDESNKHRGLEFDKDDLYAVSEKDFNVHADSTVWITSDENDVEIAAEGPPLDPAAGGDLPKLTLRCGPDGAADQTNYLRAWDKPVDGHTIEIMGHGTAQFEITVGRNTSMKFFGTTGIDMKVTGSPEVEVWFVPETLKFNGGSLFVWMSQTIALTGKGGVQFAE